MTDTCLAKTGWGHTIQLLHSLLGVVASNELHVDTLVCQMVAKSSLFFVEDLSMHLVLPPFSFFDHLPHGHFPD